MDLKEEMARLLSREPLDLVTAALILGQLGAPRSDSSQYREILGGMSEELAIRVKGVSSAEEILEILNAYLFEELGFKGNSEDYYDPRNSFLQDALDRRLGIPITLSLIYVHLGRRLGLPLFGIGFPGHFLVKYEGSDEVILLDPYNAGRMLKEGDLKHLLDELYQDQLAMDPAFLQSVTERQFLSRMLNNLKGIYMRSEDFDRLIQVLDLILLLNPDSAVDVRDRGLVYYEMGNFVTARSDLARYRELHPHAEDAEVIEAHLREIESQLAKFR